MLIGGILLGLLLGLLAGGSLANLAAIRLRWLGLLLTAIALRFATDALLNADVAIIDALRLPLLAAALSMLLVGLWANRDYPGLSLAFVGVLSNTAVIVVNGGYMPIYEPSLRRRRLHAGRRVVRHPRDPAGGPRCGLPAAAGTAR